MKRKTMFHRIRSAICSVLVVCTLFGSCMLPVSAAELPNDYVTTTTSRLATVSKNEAVSILVIGNSFSVDSSEYLYTVAKNAGYKAVIGNLYKDSTTLKNHYKNASDNKADYTLRIKSSDKWQYYTNRTISYALTRYTWDVVVIHQHSSSAGRSSTYYTTVSATSATNDNSNPDVPIEEAATALEPVPEETEEVSSEELSETEESTPETEKVSTPEAVSSADQASTSETPVEALPISEYNAVAEALPQLFSVQLNYGSWLADYIRATSANKSVKVGFELTWAFPQDSTTDEFDRYDNNQMTMYNRICSAVKEYIQKTGKFDFVAPVGTTIQNARSSYLGDTLNRDARHLTYDYGRYLAAMSLAYACGVSLSSMTQTGVSAISSKYLPVMRSSVLCATTAPYQVTKQTTITPMLAAPAFKSIRTSSAKRVFTWSHVNGATGYIIYRIRLGQTAYTKIATLSANKTTYTNYSLMNNTIYRYVITAKGDDYIGSRSSGKYTTCYITPTSLSSVKNTKSRKMVVKWSKRSGVTGYQIQYSRSSSFSGASLVTIPSGTTTSKTITSLSKKKRYYVRIRTYTKLDGKIYYSTWSSKKSVKISK